MSWSVDEQQIHKHLYVGSKTSVSIGGPIDALKVHGSSYMENHLQVGAAGAFPLSFGTVMFSRGATTIGPFCLEVKDDAHIDQFLWVNTLTKSKYVVCDIVSTRIVSKAVCGFTINHPDPNKKGMKLRYTVLEGPEIGVYCRGRVKNTNTIFLPDEWRHLVHEESITVSITPIGAYQDIFVKRIQDFAIFLDSRGGIPINAYYHIFAERKDQPKLITEFPAGQELSDQFNV